MTKNGQGTQENGRNVIRSVRFTEKQWQEIESRSARLKMPASRFLAYAALRAIEIDLPDLQIAAGVSALIDGE